MAANRGGQFEGINGILASLELQDYIPLMESAGFDFSSPKEISEDDLRKIGIEDIDHRKKILKELQNITLSEKQLDDEFRIVIIGKTGCGKSATGNTILGEEKFESKPQFSSATKKCKYAVGIRFDKKFQIVDTPGICDTGYKDKDTQNEIQQCIAISAPGPHAFILVISITRYTKEENDAVQHFIKYFGEGVYEYFIVLFTRKDDLDRANMSLEDAIENSPRQLQDFIRKCNRRVVAFDNTLRGNEQSKQVQHLLDMIIANVLRNHGKHYTNEMYMVAEKALQRRQKEIQVAKKEKNDKKLKQRLDAVEKEHQREMFQNQSQMQTLENKIRELTEKTCKGEEEAKEKDEKIRKFEKLLQNEKEYSKTMKRVFQEKMLMTERSVQAEFDYDAREQCRRELAGHKAVIDLLEYGACALIRVLSLIE